MIKEGETYYPQSIEDWRQWLEENHQIKQSVWLVYYTKQSEVPSISWREAVDEALCFGWIDSTKKKVMILHIYNILVNENLIVFGLKSIKR